jgi:hypothetical protein
MHEGEVRDSKDAAFFMANEVVNEYHAFPVVQRADLGANRMFIMLNSTWYELNISQVRNPSAIMKLEALADG